MAVYVKELIPSKYSGIAQSTQYTASNCQAIIDKFTATNTSASTATVTIYLVPNGLGADQSNAITYNRLIASGETYTFPELCGHVIGNGGYIATASDSDFLVIRCSGREIT
jgi:hypothetical protein